MKRKLSNIALIAVFIIGFIILAYPKFSDYYNRLVGSYSIGKYDGEIVKMPKIDLNTILEKAKKYNENLLKNPTGIKNGESEDENYLSQLKVKENESIIGSITIDKINVKLPIYHGTSQPVLQKGVGHLEGTTLPIGGEGTHSVLTGHTGLPSAKLFTDLEKMEKDDLIVIKILDKTLTYKVRDIQVVLPEEVDNIKPILGEDLITLITCTPYGVNSHRLLVQGERTENIVIEDTQKNIEEIKNNSSFIIMFLIIIVVITSYLIYRRYKKTKKNGGV